MFADPVTNASLPQGEACFTARLTRDGCFVAADRGFMTAVGSRPEALLGQSIDTCVIASDGGSIAGRLAVATSPFSLVCHTRTGDLAGTWLELTCLPAGQGDTRGIGDATHHCVFAIDVTARHVENARLRGQMTAIDRSYALADMDLDGVIRDINQRFVEVFGYSREDIVGRHSDMLISRDQAEGEGYRQFWAELRAGRYVERELRLIRSDGEDVWLHNAYLPVLDADGVTTHIVCCGNVVTDEVRRRSDHQSQIEAIHKSQCVAEFTLDGTILSVNERFCALFGYERDELIGQDHRILRGKDCSELRDHASNWDALRAGRFCAGLYRRVSKAGRDIWLQATYNPILDPNGQTTRIIKIATDVTSNIALASAFEDVQRRSQHDTATGLPNRTRLISFMGSVLAGACGMVVLYLDLDRFKPVNDSLGHHAGDHVLAVVADRLRRVLSYDQLAARIGGDEFVIVAPDMHNEAVEGFCRQVIDSVGDPIHFEGHEIRVGVSIGIATAPADATTPDDLLRCADIALYRAKQAGRDRFAFYSGALNDRLLSYQAQVEELRAALEGEQFVLEFQPRYHAATQTMSSVEALVRWRHPLRGIVPPGEFIPIAERSRLILPLGAWVLREACRVAVGWPGIGVSVNLSPVQIHEMDVVALVGEVLRETGLAPGRLELEITEGTLFADAARARTALLELKALGVRIAMDDFGVGYSSLGSLRSFPFDVLKIDRQFIEAIDSGSAGRQIVQAILTIGRALDLSVAAEGVETRNQLSLLVDDGCPEVQGFLLSRPVSRERISEMLAVRTVRSKPERRGARGVAVSQATKASLRALAGPVPAHVAVAQNSS